MAVKVDMELSTCGNLERMRSSGKVGGVRKEGTYTTALVEERKRCPQRTKYWAQETGSKPAGNVSGS